MNVLFWQELFLIILAVLVGMPIGYLLRKFFWSGDAAGSTTAAATATAASGTAMAASTNTAAAASAAEEAVKADQDQMAAKAFDLAKETEAKLAAEEDDATNQALGGDEQASKDEANAADADAKEAAEIAALEEAAAEAKQDEEEEAELAALEEAVVDTKEAEAAQAAALAALAAESADLTSDEAENKSGTDEAGGSSNADDQDEDDAPGAAALSEDDLAVEEERMSAAIAALPKDASLDDKANAVGRKPAALLTAPRGDQPDDLKLIKGVGKVIEGKLNNIGIYHYDQVANLTRKEINWVTTFLSFKGRIDRDNWIEQAAKLAAGEETEFSKRAGKSKMYD